MQNEIRNKMQVKPTINVNQELECRIDFIKKTLIESKMKSLVLGISGGQDSTLCGKLCQLAIDELGDGYNFYAIRLPYGNQIDEKDCNDALNYIKPDYIEVVNIKDSVDSLAESLRLNISDFNKGNIKARVRMTAQYAIASEVDALVVGTDHSSEAVTGFFTKFGDGGFDFSPLFGLNKRQGKQLLKYLNCPKHLYLKVPTADLEDLKPGLSDEDALGFKYDELDDYLEGKAVDLDVRKKIENLYLKTEHKRNLPKNYK